MEPRVKIIKPPDQKTAQNFSPAPGTPKLFLASISHPLLIIASPTLGRLLLYNKARASAHLPESGHFILKSEFSFSEVCQKSGSGRDKSRHPPRYLEQPYSYCTVDPQNAEHMNVAPCS